MSFLYWLESIRCPFLDAVMQAFTCFGEELAFLLLALTIFWCVSKEEGYYLLFVGFFGTVLNQFLKLLCRSPRPWVRDPEPKPTKVHQSQRSPDANDSVFPVHIRLPFLPRSSHVKSHLS